MRTVVAVLLVAVLAPALPAKLPSYIKPCKRNDPKLNECALKHVKEAMPKIIQGEPKLGIPKLDPLVLDKIVVGENATRGGLGLAFSCENCRFIGIKNAKPRAVRVDPKKRHIELEGVLDKLEIKGKYRATGKVLVLPIEGNGDAHLVLKGLDVVYTVDYDLKKGKDGKDHAKIKNPKLTYKLDNFNIQLTNLFKGDKRLGEQMMKFLNENWRDLAKEFGPMITSTVNKVITLVINNVSDKVPFDEILLP